jgi:tRNA (5-methylaminomethyl-2-thiouridylate)-methyltransferase
MIDLDHNATTAPRPEVIEAVARALRDLPGNASSLHGPGRAARAAIEAARVEVAALAGVLPEEIVFTSGGTEGNNLVLRGLARAAAAESPGARLHVVSSPLEHPSVAGALGALGAGCEVSLVSPGAAGEITAAAVAAALRPETVLVTLAAANHELGNAYDVAALAAAARAGGALFHTDAVQAAGKLPLDLAAAGADAATLSAHKIHGPKGVGAVYVRRGLDLPPLLAGGHQEHERRAGTENVAGIVGFGVAARLARAELAEVGARVRALRDRLQARLLAVPGARLHGDATARLPGTLNVGFAGVPGQLLAVALDLEGVCVSTGAACTSGTLAPSPVLTALGLAPAEAAEAVRLSLGRDTTEVEVERVAGLIPELVARIRGRGAATATGTGTGTGTEKERVVVAMSGGVDSSVAAALLVEQGFEVVGATLRLYDAAGTPASVGGRCCGPRDIEDARATAAALGFPHYVIDESAAFSAGVVDEFVAAHRAGRTPNPCVLCNERIKFGPLLAFADAVGAATLATGHYARLLGDPAGGGLRLARAADREKDQSYFLFGVRPELLARVRFPLGDRTKADVRALAARLGLPNAGKPDSQQICFIPDGDHLAFVESRGGAGRPGAIVDDQSGAPLARHDGTHRFTVGQRRGVPAGAAGARRFVLRVDAASGEVRVGPRERLGRTALRVGDVRWRTAASAARPPAPLRCHVQIRHHAEAAPAWLEAAADGSALVRLDRPAFGVAPGQAAVFYDDRQQVIGGGWIEAD